MPLPLKIHLPIVFAGDLSPVEFEDLCCDVWKCDSDILRANRFGRSGQKQRGVDILAWKNTKQVLVGSCKNYETFDAKELDKAIGQFWRYLPHWKKRRVVGLVIFVGSQIQDVEVQTKYLDYLLKFAGESLSLELRDNVNITDCLRENRRLGIKHFPLPHVQSFLYGSSVETSSAIPSLSSSNLGLSGSLRDNIYLEFTSDVERLLPNLRTKARSGRWSEALTDIENLRGSQHWHLQPEGMDDSLRSKVLILAAALQIDARNDMAAAKARIQQAKTADPSGKFQVVESVIALREQGADRSLELLTTPESTDAWNIKLSILTNLDRCSEVLAIMASPPFEPNGGTYRVASMAAVVEGDFHQARRFIGMAISVAPDEFYIRLLAASLRYLEAILPSFKDVRFLDWPIPSGWEFVRSEPDAIKALEGAEVEFASLLKLVEAGNELRVSLEAWRLACIANHPDRQDEAARYAAGLLSGEPAHIPALVWSVERGFPFDHDASRAALHVVIRKGGGVAHVQALCTLLIESGDLQEAADQLDRSKSIYTSPNEIEIWRHLRAQLAAGLDDDSTLSTLLDQESDPKRRAQLVYATGRVVAAKSKDLPAFIAIANQAYNDTGEPHYLLEACDASLTSGDFLYVVARTDELLSKLPSTASLLVTARSHLLAGNYAKSLGLIKTHAVLIPTGRAGNMFRRIEIECNHRMGDRLTALKLAEACATTGGGFQDQITLLSLQAQGTDIPGSLRTAKQLLDDPDTPVGGLVVVARSVLTTAPHLAAAALERALDNNPPAELLPDLIPIGFQLGMDDRMAPHLQRLMGEPARTDSGMRFATIKEIQDIIRQRQKTAEHFLEAYRMGQAPIHFGDTLCGYPLLGELLALSENRETIGSSSRSRPPPIFIRSGIHASRCAKIRKGSLALDFTALLIADQLGILDLVEKEFAPLFISSHTPDLFNQIVESISDHQPLIREQDRVVLELTKEGVIRVENAESSSACDLEAGGVDVRPASTQRRWTCFLGPEHDSVPDTSLTCVSHPDRSISSDELIAAFRAGHYSARDKFDSPAAASTLEICGQMPASPMPGDTVLLEAGVARKLVANEVVRQLARLLDLRVSELERDAMKQSQLERARMESRARYLMRLIEEIQRKVGSGLYRFISKDEEIGIAADGPIGEATMALYDLHLATKQGASVVWCDDRFVNGFAGFETARIVGVSEILRILRKRRKIGKDDYFEAVNRMRAANLRYVFPTAEEIQWALARSAAPEQGFKEGAELRAIRQHIAACLTEVKTMRQPDQRTQSLMEFRWVFDVFKSVTATIAGIWGADDRPHPEKTAVSDFLLSEFFFPLLAIFELIGKAPLASEQIDGVARAITGLMAEGFSLSWPRGVDPSKRAHLRAQFYDWIADRLLSPLSHVEPDLLKGVAQIEIDALLGLWKDESKRDRHGARILKSLIAKAIYDLPDILKQEIDLPANTRKSLGLGGPTIMVTISGITFHAHDFWRGVSKASKEGHATVRGADTEDQIEFFHLPHWSTHRKLGIRGGGCPPRASFVHAALPIATLPEAQIQRNLQRRVDWLDLPSRERRLRIREIASDRDPARRVQQFMCERDNSLEYLYQNVKRRHRSGEQLVEQDLFPRSLVSLTNHLRLSKEEISSGVIDWERSARELLSDVGLARALQRFVHLPIPIPKVLVDAYGASPVPREKFTVARLIRTTRHPLAMLQISHLIASATPTSTAPEVSDAGKLIDQALNSTEGVLQWSLFKQILKWSFEIFGCLGKFREMQPSLRLAFAWMHAGRLCDGFLSGGMSVHDGRETFAALTRSYGLEIGSWNSALWDDCSHPRFAGRIPTLMAALGSILTRLPEKISGNLRRKTILGLGDESEVDPSAALLLRDIRLMRNSIGSFLGGDCASSARDAMAPDFASRLEFGEPDAVWRAALGGVEEDPGDRESWKVLVFVLDDLPIDGDSEARLRAIMLSKNFTEMVKADPASSMRVILFAANRLRHQQDDAHSGALEQHIHDRLASLSSRGNAGLTHSEVAPALATFIGFAVVPGNEVATFTRFHELLANAILRWPEFAKFLGRPNWCWPNRWPMVRQSGYWKFELVRRSVS